MQIATPESLTPVRADRSWCIWSTIESVQNDVPSVTAILETLVVVPLYWWFALRVGVLLPLLVSAAVAPLVLLRSEQAVALGVRLFERARNTSGGTPFERRILKIIALLISISFISVLIVIFDVDKNIKMFIAIPAIVIVGVAYMASLQLVEFLYCIELTSGRHITIFEKILFSLVAYVAVPISIYLYSLIVRIIATLLYLHSGILALPRNFRRLVLCTSPVQVPELVPGLEAAGSPFTLTYLRTHFLQDKNRLGERLTWGLVLFLWSFIMFLPAWLYRVTLKSTAWFWWPLAFLGGDLRRAQNPDLFHWKVMGGLWARSSIILSCMTLLGFVTSNFVFDGTIFEHNPLLTPLGYLFLFNWNIRPWQVCAILGSLLSVIIVLSVHDVSGEYRIAQETDNDDLRRTAQRKLGWIERLARFRLIILLIFWALIGTHAFLYENGQKCWFSLTPRLHAWAETLYGDQLPRSTCHT